MTSKPPPGNRPVHTLDRALSKAGACSRTEAGRRIQAGAVRVNGKVVRDPELWVDLERDHLELDGAPVDTAKPVHLLLYKPKGVLTTRTDPEGRKTVYDLLEGIKSWVHPVGRLDMDTSGLLILTNDSQLAERLTNPDFHVPKTYLVKASLGLSDAQLAALAAGVELDDGPTRPAGVRRVREAGGRTIFEITITEGRNRQVRRMVESLGAKVLKLVRISIGALRIDDLPIGHWRNLSPEEVRLLRSSAKSRLPRQAPGEAPRAKSDRPRARHSRPGAQGGPQPTQAKRPRKKGERSRPRDDRR